MINGVKVKAVLEEPDNNDDMGNNVTSTSTDSIDLEFPSFLKKVLGKGKKKKKIGMVNMDEEVVREWNRRREDLGEAVPFRFERVTDFFKWEDLFPEWIDEEEESDVPTCPEIPMPDLKSYGEVDLVVAKLPCNDKARRDVFRLQVHLIVANMVVKKGKRDWNYNRRKTKVVFWSKCRPMMELFRCSDLVKREGDWWLYQPQIAKLEHKLALPVGSCQLALPLWGQGKYVYVNIDHVTLTVLLLFLLYDSMWKRFFESIKHPYCEVCIKKTQFDLMLCVSIILFR